MSQTLTGSAPEQSKTRRRGSCSGTLVQTQSRPALSTAMRPRYSPAGIRLEMGQRPASEPSGPKRSRYSSASGWYMEQKKPPSGASTKPDNLSSLVPSLKTASCSASPEAESDQRLLSFTNAVLPSSFSRT